MSVLSRGVPSSYGNRFRSPTSPSRDPSFFNNPLPPLLSPPVLISSPARKPCTRLGMNIANLRVEERTVLTQPYSVLSLQPKLTVGSSLSFSSTFFTSRAAHQTPFFPFSRFVPRFYFLFLLEKRTKERDETRERWVERGRGKRKRGRGGGGGKAGGERERERSLDAILENGVDVCGG